MSRLRQQFRRASADLGIEIHEDFEVRLLSGDTFTAPILVSNFGGERGTLVIIDYGSIHHITSKIINTGYGYSTLDEPREDETYQRDAFIEMLSDWGWSGDRSNTPSWLRPPHPER